VKKRLRKKNHRGEFQEFGFRVRFRIASALSCTERDRLLWDGWIIEAIEGNDLSFGGGGRDVWDGLVTLSGHGSATEEHRQILSRWLAANPLVLEYTVFPLVDAWYGDPWKDEITDDPE
jgi:uncharacterized protein YggL (DUF469 family)